ncbi:endonuclease/exonuclease/phosphatase family protein [Romboutsia maritimum]|uniref:Endonuclease/exonuclease/phosphatase family protein n=2 Tax=Romboutsia maritimum TaxID=2020948 RepID=A0A371ISB1_9FIRM|nr:endonuclease/exonuclease/phosphatase family protein [Romboutsia maritimum]
MIITDYKPKSEVNIVNENNQSNKINKNEEISLTTFNTGYCGTDKDVDFFMDGGTMSRAISKERVNENVNGIINIMDKLNSDIYFLQEVDKSATRSFKVNQYEAYQNKFKEYGCMFAINYKVPWVPVPLSKPHGKVLAGITTMSKYNVANTVRYDLPGKENFIHQLADLDRCMMVSRISVEDERELVLINAHLSAYDKGGKIRVQQLGFVKEFLNKEYKKGNYVILGGDFNQQLPGTDYNLFKTTQEKPGWLQDIPKDFNLKGFNWAVDKEVPTCRTLDISYKEGENLLSVIDGFLVSDNIEISKVKGSNFNFKYTDHNPVTIRFKLK